MRQSPIRLFRHRPNEQKRLPKDFLDTVAFIDPAIPEVAVIVSLMDIDDDPLMFYHAINHENLHTVLHRLGFGAWTNRRFDRFLASPLHHYFGLEDMVFLIKLGF